MAGDHLIVYIVKIKQEIVTVSDIYSRDRENSNQVRPSTQSVLILSPG
jgi:hypothetical protein